MTRSQCLCTPDLLALGNGDAVDVSPLHSGGDDTLIFGFSRVYLMSYFENLEKPDHFQTLSATCVPLIQTVPVIKIRKISP